MKRVFGHPLLLSIVTIGVLYVVFAHLLYPPLPQSLVIQYMVICVVGVLLVASFEEEQAAEDEACFGDSGWVNPPRPHP